MDIGNTCENCQNCLTHTSNQPQVVKLPNWTYQTPLTIHLLITSRCNLNCPKCFYRTEENQLSLPTLTELLHEWHFNGVKSIAIGGGEPLLHPNIVTLTKLAKTLGFYVAVTTNGTIKKRIYADRIHISHDRIHPTTQTQVKEALNYYRRFATVGINHIVTDRETVREVSKLKADKITLLMEKPHSRFKGWRELLQHIGVSHKFWIDACITKKLGIRKNCNQGVTSMSIHPNLTASKCSNIKASVNYTTLKETWRKVKDMRECLITPKQTPTP